jgi:hypothetical protein
MGDEISVATAFEEMLAILVKNNSDEETMKKFSLLMETYIQQQQNILKVMNQVNRRDTNV